MISLVEDEVDDMINKKIRKISQFKENQRQAFICRYGKGVAPLSLPYSKYPELITPGGGGNTYDTSYTLDDDGRVKSITYRFPEEAWGIPVINNGTDYNLEFDNYNSTTRSSELNLNYNNIKIVKLDNEILNLGFNEYFNNCYTICPNLKQINGLNGWGYYSEIGEFPELEEYNGRVFYYSSPTLVIDNSVFPKLKKISGIYGTEGCFQKSTHITIDNLEECPNNIGGTDTVFLSFPKLDNPPLNLGKNITNLRYLKLGTVTKSLSGILPKMKSVDVNSNCQIDLKVGSSQQAISSLQERGFIVGLWGD